MVDARLFQALSDPTRLKILLLLSHSTMNVTSIVNEVRAAQPAVSRHLRVLREASLINHLRKGKEVEYSLNLPQLRDAKLYIEALAGGMGEGEGPEVAEIAVPVAQRVAAAAPAAVAAPATVANATPRAKQRVRRKVAVAKVEKKQPAKPVAKVEKQAAKPTRKEPRKPAAVTASKEYIIERQEADGMDDFLL